MWGRAKIGGGDGSRGRSWMYHRRVEHGIVRRRSFPRLARPHRHTLRRLGPQDRSTAFNVRRLRPHVTCVGLRGASHRQAMAAAGPISRHCETRSSSGPWTRWCGRPGTCPMRPSESHEDPTIASVHWSPGERVHWQSPTRSANATVESRHREEPMVNGQMQQLMSDVIARNPHEPEFHQAVKEVLGSLETVLERHPEYRRGRRSSSAWSSRSA